MYRLKYYYISGKSRFENSDLKELSCYLRAREQMTVFHDVLEKIDIYQDDKLIATVYG